MWVAGVRDGKLYSVSKRPIDPQWSKKDLHNALGLCANAQHLGFDPERAFRAAEGIIMKLIYHGISWPESEFTDDMRKLEVSREQH